MSRLISQTRTSQTGTSHTGTSQTGTSQTGTSQTGTSQTSTRTAPRSRRAVAGLTAALAGGAALVAVPAVSGFTSPSQAPSRTVADESAVHHIAYPADPNGIGREMLPMPPTPVAVAPRPAAAQPHVVPAGEARRSVTNGGERASRSTTRSALGASSAAGSTARGGSPQAIAQSMLASRGWSGQFSCLNSLWTKESGWSVSAANPSGAYGIPQALPGSKMASAGSDWRTSPATQIEWGLDYIAGTYGSPCAAWAHSQANNWY